MSVSNVVSVGGGCDMRLFAGEPGERYLNDTLFSLRLSTQKAQIILVMWLMRQPSERPSDHSASLTHRRMHQLRIGRYLYCILTPKEPVRKAARVALEAGAASILTSSLY